jgi:hypothetical protein
MLEWIFGDHCAGQAQASGAFQLPDPVLDVVEVDHRDALEPRGIGAAELGEPVPERRRRWSSEQKQAIVAAAFKPGALVRDVAGQANVTTSLIYRWR